MAPELDRAPSASAPPLPPEIAKRPLALWRCPSCLARLARAGPGPGLTCAGCADRFDLVDDIPDLRRGSDASWIGRDLAQARTLAASAPDLERLVTAVFGARADWDAERIARRTRELLEEPDRLEPEVSGWLAPTLAPGRLFVDLGCGPGALLAAAARQGRQGVGIDASMTWLVVAKRRLEAVGAAPVLACAFVERLPLPTGAFHGVVSLDVIEHVNDVAGHLEEIDRIAAPGARLALSTPNRFSLAPEPHVGVLGVGWLPRPLQARYVRWRAGLDYRGTALLSSRALCAAIRRRTGFSAKVLIPPISPFEIRSFRPAKRRLAMAYNRVHGWPAARWFSWP